MKNFPRLGKYLTALVFSAVNVTAGAAPYRISVLTCAPGNEDISSVFGHTAIRVVDESTGRDAAYNFGYFDYDTPNFYLRFLRGTLIYSLSVTDGERFHEYYTQHGRAVTEQLLNLDSVQAAAIAGMLRNAMRPENSVMTYRFTAGNCTTQVRGIVIPAVGGNEDFLASPSGHTYRHYLNSYLGGMPWLRLGINMMLGAGSDRNTDMYGSMFLPDMFFDGLAPMRNGGEELVLLTLPMNDVERRELGSRSAEFLQAGILLALLALCLLNRGRLIPACLFILAGTVGCVITFATIYSLHTELQWNLNVLWCNPLYLLLAWAVVARRTGAAKYTAITIAGCSGVSVILWIAGIQTLSIQMTILIAVLMVSAYRAYMKITGYRQYSPHRLK